MKNRVIPKTGEQLRSIKRKSNWTFLIIIISICLIFYLMTIFRMMS